MSAALALREATVVLHGRTVLRGITMQVDHSQFWGIAGPNGAGKSTLVKLLAGFVPLNSGQVQVLGRDLAVWPLTELRRRVGYLPQHLFFDEGLPLSAREVILIGRTGLRGLLRRLTRQDREAAVRCAEELGVENLLERPFGTLSGGERQRVLLARALSQEPEILILDEPTAGLDPRAAVRFLDSVDQLQGRRRMTVLVVTHEISSLPAGCGQVALVRDGSLMAAGPKESLLSDSVLSDLYGCRVEVGRRGERYHVFQE